MVDIKQDNKMTTAEWVQVDTDLCMMHCDSLSAHQQTNRTLLMDVMTSVRFIN